MDKTWDRPLVEYIVDCWKSLEIVEYIQFLGYEWNPRVSSIDVNRHIFKRDKGKKKKEKFDYKFINDDRCGLLTVHIKITKPEVDVKTGANIIREKTIHKDMLIPVSDEDNMFFINGKRYYMIYQLVEKSTYTTANSNVVKSLMPLNVKRVTKKYTDVDDVEYITPVYNTFIFKRELPIMAFVAANGLEYGLAELQVSAIIDFVETIPDDETRAGLDYLYFQVSSKCFIRVNKELFLKYTYVQSIVGGLLEILTNRFTISQINDTENFIKKLSPTNKYEKGRDYLVLFNRLLDITTKKILKLNDFHTHDVYAILRWVMMNFNEIRMKDNMSLDNKRLRCNEMISQLLTQEFSNKLNRVVSMGSKASMDDICDMFKFPGNILLQKMHSSGLLRFDESINDMTFFTKFKWTSKGPHSLGRKNSNNISTKYRGVHPSMMGRFDLLVCGNSDPGTSGILSPFTDMKSLYFDSSDEPDQFIFDFMADINKKLESNGVECVQVQFTDKEDYYRIMNHAREFGENNFKVFGVTKDSPEIIFAKEDDVIAEHEIETEV